MVRNIADLYLVQMNVMLCLIADETWFNGVNINLRALEGDIAALSAYKVTSEENRTAWALKALTLTDLTTLAGDDCHSNVERLCIRAAYPFAHHSIRAESEFQKKLHVAAVCVYPTKVIDARNTLHNLGFLQEIQIAAGNCLLYRKLIVTLTSYN